MADFRDDRQFCPTCQEPRTVLYIPNRDKGLTCACRSCPATFTLSESEKARLEHVLRTVSMEAAKVPR